MVPPLVGQVEGNLFKVTNKVVNLFVAPLFLLFFLALFVRRSTVAGTWIGAVASVAVALTIAFWEDVTGSKGISFLWIMPAAFAGGAGAGILGSFMTRRWSNQSTGPA